MELTRGTDDGAYLNWQEKIQFNWQDLYDKAGIRWAAFRGDQEQIDPVNGNYSTMRNLEASRRVLPINACYYWHYPDGNQKYYLDRYSRAIDKEQPDFIGVDHEQTLVYDPIQGKYVQVDPNKFSDTAQELDEGLAARYPEKQISLYTRENIVSFYSPPMKKWIGKFDGGWEAGWRDYGLKPYTLTWEQINANMIKDAATGKIVLVDSENHTSIPKWTKRSILQYSSRILPPYSAGSIYLRQMDWCVFYGSLTDMLYWIKKQIPPVTPPVPALTLESLDARVKKLEAKIEAMPLYKVNLPIVMK